MEAKTSLQQLRRQRASSGPDKVPVLVETLDEYTRTITALFRSFQNPPPPPPPKFEVPYLERYSARYFHSYSETLPADLFPITAPRRLELGPDSFISHITWMDRRDVNGTSQELGQTLLSTYHCCLESLILGFQQGMDLNDTIRLASPPTPYHRLSAAARPSGPLDADPARHKHLELRGQGTATATRSSLAVCRALKAW
ncbi:hypothetical protein CNYM01_13023 [Colletotrichum nymphaeae SA-01]|uniref:Uncharacterized protein n=1 Tax=Colletotrichum nymphaeae SA-01 TaxID=1460502 RepID=A0A135SB53_9PEZI|nr:hypothetical protein CNYM01_13023 [Colletotrichum nymphaeae SA-01]